MSGPARADQYDFVMQLDNMGVSYESILDMIDIGKELCHDLRSGATPPVVLDKLQTRNRAEAAGGPDGPAGVMKNVSAAMVTASTVTTT